MRIRNDGKLDRRFKANRGKSDPSLGSKGGSGKSGCLKKLGCLGLILLPIALIFGFKRS